MGRIILIGFVVVIAIVLAAYVSGAFNDIMPSSGPTPWKCYPGIYAPIRKNVSGNVECPLAKDGVSCTWGANDAACSSQLASLSADAKTLTCGPGGSVQKIYGITGYDDPKNWCAKGKVLIQ